MDSTLSIMLVYRLSASRAPVAALISLLDDVISRHRHDVTPIDATYSSVQESLVVISAVVVLHAADNREVVFSLTANLSGILTLK